MVPVDNLTFANWLVRRQVFSEAHCLKLLQYCDYYNLNFAEQLLTRGKISHALFAEFQRSESAKVDRRKHELFNDHAASRKIGKGTVIDGWTVNGQVGQGGMGTVFTITNPDFPGATRALKVLRNTSGDRVERFSREAQAIAQVAHHKNIVTIHAYGTYESQNYIMMELVEGQSLEQLLLSDSALSEREVCILIKKIASALEVIHQGKIIHRDLKPANIMIRPDGEPVLLDFGLALQLDLETLTLSQQTLGTPHYMAPEQIAGERHSYGPSTDLFSLGVIFYQCLTGQRPFDSESSQALMTQIASVDPQPPSRVSPRVSKAASNVCMRTLQKEIKYRYQTAAELQRDLDAVLAGTYRQQFQISSKLLIFVVVGLIAVFVAITAVDRLRDPFRSLQTTSQAELERERQQAARDLLAIFLNSKPRSLSNNQRRLWSTTARLPLDKDYSSEQKQLIFHRYLSLYLQKRNTSKHIIKKLNQSHSALVDDLNTAISQLEKIIEAYLTAHSTQDQYHLDLNYSQFNRLQQILTNYKFTQVAGLVKVTQDIFHGQTNISEFRFTEYFPSANPGLDWKDIKVFLDHSHTVQAQPWRSLFKRHFHVKKELSEGMARTFKAYLKSHGTRDSLSELIVAAVPFPEPRELMRLATFLEKQSLLNKEQLADLYKLYAAPKSFCKQFVATQNYLVQIANAGSSVNVEYDRVLQTLFKTSELPFLDLDLLKLPQPLPRQKLLNLQKTLANTLFLPKNVQPETLYRLNRYGIYLAHIVNNEAIGGNKGQIPTNFIQTFPTKLVTRCSNTKHQQIVASTINSMLFWLKLQFLEKRCEFLFDRIERFDQTNDSLFQSKTELIKIRIELAALLANKRFPERAKITALLTFLNILNCEFHAALVFYYKKAPVTRQSETAATDFRAPPDVLLPFQTDACLWTLKELGANPRQASSSIYARIQFLFKFPFPDEFCLRIYQTLTAPKLSNTKLIDLEPIRKQLLNQLSSISKEYEQNLKKLPTTKPLPKYVYRLFVTEAFTAPSRFCKSGSLLSKLARTRLESIRDNLSFDNRQLVASIMMSSDAYQKLGLNKIAKNFAYRFEKPGTNLETHIDVINLAILRAQTQYFAKTKSVHEVIDQIELELSTVSSTRYHTLKLLKFFLKHLYLNESSSVYIRACHVIGRTRRFLPDFLVRNEAFADYVRALQRINNKPEIDKFRQSLKTMPELEKQLDELLKTKPPAKPTNKEKKENTK